MVELARSIVDGEMRLAILPMSLNVDHRPRETPRYRTLGVMAVQAAEAHRGVSSRVRHVMSLFSLRSRTTKLPKNVRGDRQRDH
jgi:hypothetical protein